MESNEPFKNPFVITPDEPGALPYKPTYIEGAKPKVEAPVSQPSEVPQPEIKSKTYLVVDTNVLLKQQHLRDLFHVDSQKFDEQFEVVTLDSVIAEVRDPKSREYIEHKLPYALSVKQRETFLEKIDIDQVENFAKDTGDFVSLSKVDTQVIALGVRLAKSIGEGHLIRREPKDLSEFKPAQIKQAYDQLSSDSEDGENSSDSDGGKAADSDDEWGEVKATRTERRTKEFKQRKKERYEKKM